MAGISPRLGRARETASETAYRPEASCTLRAESLSGKVRSTIPSLERAEARPQKDHQTIKHQLSKVVLLGERAVAERRGGVNVGSTRPKPTTCAGRPAHRAAEGLQAPERVSPHAVARWEPALRGTVRRQARSAPDEGLRDACQVELVEQPANSTAPSQLASSPSAARLTHAASPEASQLRPPPRAHARTRRGSTDDRCRNVLLCNSCSCRK